MSKLINRDYLDGEVSLLFEVSLIKLVLVSVVLMGTSFFIPASGTEMVELSVESVVESPELHANAKTNREIERIFFIIII
jgi:hypothetical protein